MDKITKNINCLIFLLLLISTTSTLAQKSQMININKNDSLYNIFNNLADSIKLIKLKEVYIENIDSGDYTNSIITLKHLASLDKTFSDSIKKAQYRMLVNAYLGQSYNKIGLYSKAMKYSFNSLFEAKKRKDTSFIIMSLTGISFQYRQINKYDLALKNAFEALKYAKQTNKSVSNVLNNIGNTYLQAAKFDSARLYYRKKESLKDISFFERAIINMNIGETFRLQNSLDSALWYFNISSKYVQSNFNPMFVSMLNNNYAEVYYTKKKYGKAEDYALKSLKTAKEKNDFNLIISNYKLLALLYAKTDKKDKSVLFQNKFSFLKDSISTVNQQIAISAIELMYKEEINALEIKNLKSESLIKSVKLNVSIFFSILMVLIFAFVAFQKRKLKKAYNKLVKDSIEAKDLHEENSALRIELNKTKKLKFDFEEERKTLSESKNNKLTEKQKKFLEFEIRKAFDEDKIFLNKDLNLNLLAENINSNRNYLSQIFNSVIQINFTEMVNTYRINEAKKILLSEDGAKYTFEAIAEKSGFNSYATFYRAFVKITGITPSFFIKNVSKISN